MLNRRFLRVKALQSIYAYHQSESANLPQAERQLLEGVDDLYKLFVYQLSFWVELKQFAERRIEENKHKHFPTEEDLNPNMKFVNNRILKALDDNKHLMKLEEQYKINWADSREDFIRNMFTKLTETPEYQEYMTNGKDTFSDDKRFLVTIIDTYMAENGLLYDYYSDRDLSFNSDYQLAIYLLWKYISELPADFNADSMLPPMFKDEAEDKAFRESVYELALAELLADPSIREQSKQIFVRVAINGEKPEDVAAAFGVTRNSVDQTKARLVAKLRIIKEELVISG